ncbi:MAG: response regulator [Actinobacteria bacterium]|nr:response regulator [Actinomycetota bacterium]
MARVLIVDDERLIQQLLSSVLEREGHSATVAGSVPEARGHLEKDDFDLVVCDVDMPGESGFDLVRSMRSRGSDTPIVMMSGIEDARLAAAAVDFGIAGFMIKPFQLDEARAKVAEALRRRAEK